MSNELPDLDEDVSFVVDDGAPTGPIPLRTIIDSIRSGERAPDVLVWWAGAPEWEQFTSNPSLFGLLQDLPASNQPPPPPDHDEETTLSEGTAVVEDRAVDDYSEISEEAVVNEEARLLDVDESDTEEDALEEAEPEEAHSDEQASASAAADAQADVLLARDSRAMHPSSRWGLDEPATESTVVESMAPKLIMTEFDVPKFDEPAAEMPQEANAPEPSQPDSSLTGLFSASARTDAGLSGETATASAEDVATSARLSLQNVGARIDALTSATRRTPRMDVYPLDEVQAIEPESATIEDPVDEDVHVAGSVLTPAAEPHDQSDDPATEEDGELRVAVETRELEGDTETEEPALSAGSWQAVAELSEVIETYEPATALGDRFAEMVRNSVEHQRRLDWATRVDELLLSACITAIVDSGYLLLESTSNDSDHRVLFDHNDDSRHVRLELSPLSPLNAAGDHIGRHLRVGLEWGRGVADRDVAFAVARSEAIDGDVAPGTLTCEVNMLANSASTGVRLIWAADEFVRDDHSVDRASLDASIASVLHALEARWYELFEPAR